ncbi:MAG: SGNH/GDSL hydrolase family protein [Christensenellales bacterium]|jgi:acyl-CoA thioesterase-1
MITDRRVYLKPLRDELRCQWPDYQPHYIACHGHSVVTGAFAKSQVRPFNAYPHLWYRLLNERFPTALISMIITAIGGEHAASGAERFQTDALSRKPDLVTIDYSLNDRTDGLEKARGAWSRMLDEASAADVPVILLTPTLDAKSTYDLREYDILRVHAEQVKSLASEYGVGLVDPFAAFERYLSQGGVIEELLS